MNLTAKILTTAFFVLVCVGIVLSAGRIITPDSSGEPAAVGRNPVTITPVGSSSTLWLSKFENRMVRVTFVETPPDLEKQFTCPLVKAEQTGIVLRFGNQRQLFFPYSNIICVDPM
jgi:hypothetical protein